MIFFALMCLKQNYADISVTHREINLRFVFASKKYDNVYIFFFANQKIPFQKQMNYCYQNHITFIIKLQTFDNNESLFNYTNLAIIISL